MRQYIFGALGALLGMSMVIKTDVFLRTFGRIDWFEENLANSGGSRAGYKIIGVLFLFFSLMALTGMFEAFAGGILTKIFVR